MVKNAFGAFSIGFMSCSNKKRTARKCCCMIKNALGAFSVIFGVVVYSRRYDVVYIFFMYVTSLQVPKQMPRLAWAKPRAGQA